MSFNIDVASNEDFFKELREDFYNESDDQLGIIESEILSHEKDKSIEHINEIKRYLHSMKGSSQAVGCLEFSRCVHDIESKIDNGQLCKNNVVEFRSILLACVDVLRLMTQAYQDESQVNVKMHEVNLQKLIARL